MDGERECVKFLPGLDLTFLKACPCMTWPSAEQRQRLLSSDSLKAAGRPGPCILAPSEADGFALNPETNGHPRPRGLPARQPPQLAQQEPAWLGPACLLQLVIWLRHPSLLPVSFSLGAVFIFSWLLSEAEGRMLFPAGREQALEQGGGREAALRGD